ncbi:MAG: HAMP domain-containing histidine kinase [Lachnospiraceae bacterium]|nr:HAMP domain-containing histidine kinase [Lachnospiraceae bacterium]
MEIWFGAFAGIMAAVFAVLFLKIRILQKAAREIEHDFTEKLKADTNTLVDLSCNDRHMRSLADAINIQLRELQKQRHQFQQGDLELKSAVLNISHDLRTPLTAVCGYLDLLEEEEMPKTAKRYLAVIRNRTEAMARLTEELFQYSVVLSSEDKLKKEPVVINSILEESIAAYYVSLKERGIAPKVQIPEQKIVRMLDRSALSRIFSNLLQNAVKYSGGDLDITLTEEGEIVFANTAPGLTKVQAGRLFDRFYTVETAEKSTGLGLSISKVLVLQMDGNISAEYEKNQLTIYLSFPSIIKN